MDIECAVDSIPEKVEQVVEANGKVEVEEQEQSPTKEEKELMEQICKLGTKNGKTTILCDNWELYYQLTEISANK